MKKIILGLGCFLIITLITVLVAVYFEYQKFVTTRNQTDLQSAKVIFEVPKNATGEDVIQKLEKENLLSSAFWFKVYSKFNNLPLNFNAGIYELPTNMKFSELISEFQNIQNKDIMLTIIPGLRVDEIVESIDKTMQEESDSKFSKINYSKEELESYVYGKKPFNHPAAKIIPQGQKWEGILIGDTYFIKQGATTEEMLTKILDHFWDKFQQSKDHKSSKVHTYTDYEILTLASIIEKENDNTIENAGLISGVFVNRLETNTPLGSDVTTLYSKGDWREIIYQTDLDNVNDSYNTRVHTGLPPTPICNPTVKSLNAAFDPTNTEYLFFIADRTGKIRFGKTLYEHNQNISKYGLSGE